MTGRKKPSQPPANSVDAKSYGVVLNDVAVLLEEARRASARAVNTVMTATYWEIGRRIVEFEQGGESKAEYGELVIERLSKDLTERFGKGFSKRNIEQMRRFYLCWPIAQTLSAQFENAEKLQTVSEKSASIRQTLSAEFKAEPNDQIVQTPSGKLQTVSAQSSLSAIAVRFPLPWSHYVRLMAVENAEARKFYEEEALRGGWSVRQLDRQASSQFYERTLLSRNKAAMLKKGSVARAEDLLTPEEEIKDPYVLEFLGLKDEYSETELENALIHKLEEFLLELGGDFCFVGRQKRLRVGDEWYRVDLLFFHRGLKCLVVIDLKVGRFTHADAGQMNLYLNYAREHWTHAGENPPVGLILCAAKDEAVAHYALDGLKNKVLAAEYKMALPDEKLLADELRKTRRQLDSRRPASPEAGKRGR